MAQCVTETEVLESQRLTPQENTNMSHTPRYTSILALFASLFVLAAACSKDDAGGSKAAGSAMGYLPKDASLVVGVNVAKARKSRLYKEYKPMLDKLLQDDDYKKIQDTCGIDAVNKLEQAVIAMGKDPKDENGMWVVVTGLTKSKIGDCVDKLKANGDKVDKKDEGDLVAYTVDGKTMYVWWPTDNTLVTGPAAEDKPDELKKLATGGDKLKDNKELMAMVEKTDTGAMLWMAGGLPPNMPAMATSGLPGGPPESLYVSFNLPGDLKAKIGLVYKDEDTAKTAEAGLNDSLKQAKDNPMAAGYVTGVKIDRSGKDVKASIELSEEDVKTLTSMAKMMMN